MANFEDKLRTDSQDFAKKIPVYNHYGKLRNISFEYDLDGSNVLAAGDKIYGVVLPKNAKVIDAYVKSPSMGATGIFSLGLKNDTAEDSDSLVESADAGGQAVLERAGAGSVAIGSLLEVENQLVLEVVEATTATSGKITAEVIIAVE